MLQHLIKAPPVSFLGAGGGELLPTELAALDSILGDDTVISLGGVSLFYLLQFDLMQRQWLAGLGYTGLPDWRYSRLQGPLSVPIQGLHP